MSAAGKALATAMRMGDRSAFNADRKKRPAIDTERFDDIRLRGFRLESLDFFFCTFTKVTFHDVKAINFTRCTFVDCKFEPNPKKSHVEVADSNFVECEFAHTAFGAAKFSDCRFLQGNGGGIEFDENTTFIHTEFKRVKGLSKATNLYAIELDPAEVSYISAKSSPFDDIVNWRKLGLFSRLPILNVSYIFLVGMAGYAIVASSVLELLATLLVPLLETDWSKKLAQDAIAALHTFVVPRVETLLVIASFIALAAAGTIYKLSAPSQIQEYSLDNWTLELKRHRLTYESLILIRPMLCAAAFVLTAGAFLVLGTLTVVKFLNALTAFAGAG